MGSGSTVACLLEARRALVEAKDFLVERGVGATMSSAAGRMTVRLVVRLAGVAVTVMLSSALSSSSSSLSPVLDWLEGTSTMPLVERTVRDWTLSIFLA